MSLLALSHTAAVIVLSYHSHACKGGRPTPGSGLGALRIPTAVPWRAYGVEASFASFSGMLRAYRSFLDVPDSLTRDITLVVQGLSPSHPGKLSQIAYIYLPTNMASTKLPPVETVPSLSAEERAQILDLLFEPSTQLHTLSVPLLHEKTFPSYNDLIAAVGMQLSELSESSSTSDTQWLESILGSHPRLGAKKVDSAQSQAEQAQLQGSGEEAELLRKLNEEYEAKFPGLRYVVFVNGRSRSVIMDDMRQRIDSGDLVAERAAAIRVSSIFLYAAQNVAQVLIATGDVRDRGRSCCKISMSETKQLAQYPILVTARQMEAGAESRRALLIRVSRIDHFGTTSEPC